MVSDRVTINITDAFSYLDDNKQLFDFIIGDLPDPNNNALARLYSKQFYQLIRSNLAEDGVFVTQATSPYFATDAFWSINRTVQAAGFNFVQPYHAQVPSFGEWGFVMASSIQKDVSQPEISVDTRFLDESSFANLFVFEKDIRSDNVEVNELDQPILLSYYLKGWKYYAR